MENIKIGDIVLNTKKNIGNDDNNLVYLVTMITNKMVIVRPFTKKGYVSTSHTKNIYLVNFGDLKIYRKYSRAVFCPNCIGSFDDAIKMVNNASGYIYDNLIWYVAKKTCIYESKFKCRVCKHEWRVTK